MGMLGAVREPAYSLCSECRGLLYCTDVRRSHNHTVSLTRDSNYPQPKPQGGRTLNPNPNHYLTK
jgi:hypothetical protein